MKSGGSGGYMRDAYNLMVVDCSLIYQGVLC